MRKIVKIALAIIFLVGIPVIALSAPTWVPVDGISPEQPPRVTVVESNDQETILEIRVFGFMVDETEINGETYQDLRFPNYYTTLDVGMPQLPAISELVAIPEGAEAEVQIDESFYVTLENYNVYPFQTPLLEDESRGGLEKDNSFYGEDTFYPENLAELGQAGIWRNLNVVNLRAYPVAYNPYRDELKVYTSVTVKITYSGLNLGYPTGSPVSPGFDNIFKHSIANYSFLHMPVKQPDTGGGFITEAYDYLIIAADAYVDDMSSFATWKNSIGLATTIVPLSSVGYTVQAIKDYIVSEYQTNGISYVLLVGNENEIPGYTGYGSFSDYYYALVDGGDDYADIGVGRFCVHSVEQLDWMIEKSVAYEGNPVGGEWLENALLVAHLQNAPYKYQQCKEEIRTAAETQSGTYSVLYPNFTTAYGADEAHGGDAATNADVIDYINHGQRVVNYRGHGDNNIWWSWNITSQHFGPAQVDSLDNGAMTPVVFSIACYNANLQYGPWCLGECFTLREDGAAAFLGATRPSYTVANHTYDKKIFAAIFDEGINAVSDASNIAATEMIIQHGGAGLANARMYLWLGDPALEVIYEGPQPQPRTRYVPDEYPTIQSAIDACIDFDTVMVAPGLYRESIDFLGKNILVTSSLGPNVTTIQGIYRSRAVVYFQSGEPKGAELSGFTITFGHKSGIYCRESSPTITNNIISGNYSHYAEDGGGITLNYTRGALVKGNLLKGNIAYSVGAAIRATRGSTDTIAYNLFIGNEGEDIIYCLGETGLIHNNTIDCSHSESNGISNSEGGIIRVLSNIIEYAPRCGVYASHLGRAYVGFNCFYHCGEPYCGDGIIEGPGNIHDDPLLTTDYRIPPSSPCMDTGYNPQFEPNQYWLDPDGTRNDMGAFPVYQVGRANTYVYHQIQPAINDVSDGDFIYVRPGEYFGPIRFDGKRIVVSSAEGPERTIISSLIERSATVIFASSEPKGTEISGFTISGGTNSGIYCFNSSPTITNNIIQENRSEDLEVGGCIDLNYTRGSVIRNNIFTHNAAYGYGAGIFANDCFDDTICYNLFESCEGKGMIHGVRTTMAIYNNTLDCSRTLGHGILNSQSGRMDCRNNILVSAEQYGLYAGNGGTMLAEYNDVYHCGIGPFGGEGIVIGLGNIERDPLFVDYYRLSERSPCIDRGDPNPFFNDPDGSRNDMGWKYLGAELLGRPIAGDNNPELPQKFELSQSYPNPFNASATIKYSLPEPANVTLDIFDVLGRHVAGLVSTYQQAGEYQVIWNAGEMSSGTYFYRLQAGDHSATNKMVLLK